MDSDSDFEGEFQVVDIQPYMYEPIPGEIDNCHSESETESEESDVDYCPEVETWCTCGYCENMGSRTEALCCHNSAIISDRRTGAGLKCITEHEGFIANCLNRHVLETSYYDYIIENGAMLEGQLIHELYRHIAYRRFSRWCYGLLGRGRRKVIPSCAVSKIRQTFPSQHYCGFKYPEHA